MRQRLCGGGRFERHRPIRIRSATVFVVGGEQPVEREQGASRAPIHGSPVRPQQRRSGECKRREDRATRRTIRPSSPRRRCGRRCASREGRGRVIGPMPLPAASNEQSCRQFSAGRNNAQTRMGEILPRETGDHTQHGGGAWSGQARPSTNPRRQACTGCAAATGGPSPLCGRIKQRCPIVYPVARIMTLQPQVWARRGQTGRGSPR
jgi:hypothetical protein